MASEEQEKTEKDQKDTTEKEIARIEKEIVRAKETGQLNIEQLENSLQQMRKQKRKHERTLRHITERPRFLRARWGVLIPGAFFMTSMIFSGLALNLVGSAFIASLVTWILALITIVIGVYLVCQTLIVVEGVAVTSEETAFAREAQVFKTALREFEEEKKPELQLIFEDVEPPFHVEAGSETFIKSQVGLSRGDVARKAMVVFFAPPGFEFPDSPKGPRPSGRYANYVSTEIDFEDIIKPIKKTKRVKLKAPSQPNSYTAVYRLFCEGFDSGHQEFEVVVEEPDIPF